MKRAARRLGEGHEEGHGGAHSKHIPHEHHEHHSLGVQKGRYWWEPAYAPQIHNTGHAHHGAMEHHWYEPAYAHYKMAPVTLFQYLSMLGVAVVVILILAKIVRDAPKNSLVHRSWFVQL